MCTAGDLGKVRGGSEQDKEREERTAPSGPARASALNKRRVFISLDFCCVVPYYSLELIGVLFFCVCIRYQVVRTGQYSVVSS